MQLKDMQALVSKVPQAIVGKLEAACLEDGADHNDASICSELILKIIAREHLAYEEQLRSHTLPAGEIKTIEKFIKAARTASESFDSLENIEGLNLAFYDPINLIYPKPKFQDELEDVFLRLKQIAAALDCGVNELKTSRGQPRSPYATAAAESCASVWRKYTGKFPALTTSIHDGEPMHDFFLTLQLIAESFSSEDNSFSQSLSPKTILGAVQEFRRRLYAIGDEAE